MTLTSKLAKDRTAAFIAKAERLLRWGAKTQSELIGYGQCGDLDEFERIIFVLLALLSSAHEALAAAATVAGEEAWLKEFSDRREKERLLRYLWKARDADIHDAIVKWTPNFQELQIRVTDAGKAHAVSRQFRLHATQGEDIERLFHFVYEVSSHTELIAKLDRGARPRRERLAEAGVELEFILSGISLRQFATKVRGKLVTVHEPNSHLGKELSLGAHAATEAALTYYAACLAELQAQIATSVA